MADLLNLGTSALLSIQQAISTTGHNIANVNTEGYSRQRVNLETVRPELNGGNYLGNGVAVDSVERFYDQFLTNEMRIRTASHSEFQAFYDLSSRLDGLLADPAVGLSPAINKFFGAIQDVANNPGSLPERQVLMGEAQALADRFQYLDTAFRNIDAELNGRIEASVSEINSLAAGIADLNRQVVEAAASANGQPPNDLLDARDQLITDLSELVGVNTVVQSDGAINVTIGKGQSLVIGFTAEQLQTSTNPNGGAQVVVGTVSSAGAVTDLSRFFTGGELGAVLDFRAQQLDPARNQLGLVATGIAATFNEQHRLGLDLNGQPGGDFFLPLEPTTASFLGNSGLSSVSASISDATMLTGDDYNLRYDGAQWTLTNLTTKSTQSGAGPFTVEGLTIGVAGAPVAGDTFSIQPTAQGATLFSVVLDGPEGFAAASPLRSSEALPNTGTGKVTTLDITNPAALPLPGAVSLTFNPDALGAGVPGYDVVGIAGGPLAYDPALESNGKTFSLAGFDVTVSGVPDDGDVLNIENNSSGTGDNRNALALSDLQTAQTLEGGTASYQDVYGLLVADIAIQTRQAEAGANAEAVLLQQATGARDSVSGVNLDEEAANLIQFQQAYQAAAQMIAVADELFQTLLAATRR